MTAPGGRDARGYIQLPGGYPGAQGAQAPAGQQQMVPQYPTQLGQQAAQAQGSQGPIFSESQSPMPFTPTQLPWERATQQQGQQPTQAQQPGQGTQPTPQQAAQFLQQPTSQLSDINARVGGPNIPPELQGKTVGEIIGIANGLRQLHLSNLQQGSPSAGGQQSGNGTATAAPAAGPQATQTFDWRRPDESIGNIVESRLNKVMSESIGPALQPVIMQGQIAAASQAMQVAASQVPGFGDMQPAIIEKLQGVPSSALHNPMTWITAAKIVAGERAMAQMQLGNTTHQQQQYGAFPRQQVPPGQNPLPNLNSFFSEQPMQGGPGAQGVRLSDAQRSAAAAMGMGEADYAAWLGGVRR